MQNEQGPMGTLLGALVRYSLLNRTGASRARFACSGRVVEAVDICRMLPKFGICNVSESEVESRIMTKSETRNFGS